VHSKLCKCQADGTAIARAWTFNGANLLDIIILDTVLKSVSFMQILIKTRCILWILIMFIEHVFRSGEHLV
jgi:hypothetical protein